MVDATTRRYPDRHFLNDPPALPLLVFTDLDGTLLDHDAYDFAAADPALRRLHQLRIPLIPVTSKTLAELKPLMLALESRHPCIAENGAVIAVPDGYFDAGEDQTRDGIYLVTRMGLSSTEILGRAHRLREQHGFRFRGFSDMSVEEVASHTGLEPVQARQAKSRLASEPVLWLDSPQALERFQRALSEHGVQMLQGGRFWHLMGRQDKGPALRRLAERYRRNGFTRFRTVALGDSPNDLAMLTNADMPVVVKNHTGKWLAVNAPVPVRRTEAPGPQGWNRAVLEILNEMQGGEAALDRRAQGHGRG